jgi:TonB-dependent receptor
MEKHEMRRSLSSILLFLLCFCFLGTFAWAQSGKGSLSGRVVDVAGAALQGAQVELLPTAGTVATNGQGEFTITSLDPGNYTVMISYVGFEPFTKDVTITAGENTHCKAVINIQGKSEEVTVLSERQSAEVEAINRTRAAENILQVLPAEVITSLPNANIADALGRMPSVTIERDEGEGKYVQIRGTEPRLTNVMVDGITIPSPESGVRQIKLDTIASDLVESVEINKTLQANIDADGIGGSVNLRTKTASETPTMNLYGIGGYTPILQNGRNVMQGGGTLGQRFGAQKKLGILFGGTYDYNGRGINDIEPSPTAGSLVPHYDSMDLRDYVYDRTRWGATASLDYKLGEGSSVYLRGLFSTFRNWGHKWTFTMNDYDKPKYSQDWRRPNMAIGNLVAGGKHVFTSSWFAWDISAGRSRSESGSGSAKYKWAGDKSIADNCFNQPGASIYRPGWSTGCFGTGADNAVDSGNYALSGFALPTSGQSAQLNLTGSAAYAKNYHLGNHFGTFEFGGKVRNAHKFDDTYQKIAGFAASGNIPVSSNPEWASNFTDTGYYDKTYHIGPVTDYSKVRSWALANLPIVVDPSTRAANYDFIERVSAGYVMNSIDLSSRIRLVTGLRFEATHLSTLSVNSVTDPVLTDPVTGNPVVTNNYNVHGGGDYLDVLPSASLRIALDKDSNLRLVYGRGLARPNPQDMAQAVSIDNTATPTAVSLGNPTLKAEHANNYDVLYERYLKPVGLFQVGYFYKDLSDPIVQTQTIPTTGIYAGDKVSQPFNAGSAHVQGVEFGYQQHLSFLPGPMRGLGISANYSYTNSTTNGLPGRSDHPALLRQAPNTWNISPTFDTKKFSMRVGMTYNGAMIYQYQWTDGADSVGVKGPSGDNYLYSHYQIDVQATYKLPYNLSVYGYGLNLNNAVFGFYNGSPQYVVQREYYKPTYAGGIRYTFAHER